MGTRHAKNAVDRAALKAYSTSLLVNGTEVDAGSTSLCPGMLCAPLLLLLSAWCVRMHLCVRARARFGRRPSVCCFDPALTHHESRRRLFLTCFRFYGTPLRCGLPHTHRRRAD